MGKEKIWDVSSCGEYAVKLLTALAGSDHGMDHLISIGREMLGNPLVITDKSWKTLAMTADVVIPDDLHWNELLIGGCLSAQSVTSAIRDLIAEKLEQSSDPFIWRSNGAKYPRMMCKVPVNGKLAATVSVVEYFRAFSSDDHYMLKLLSDAVGALLHRSNFQQFTRGTLYENFINDLLDGKLADPDMIDERIKTLNIGLKKNAYVFVFDITGYDPSRFSVTYMRDVLEKMISGGQALIFNGKIVIAASFLRSQDIFKTELSELEGFLKKHHIRCGISRRCAKLHELRVHYEQALDALSIGVYLDADRYLYPYGEYAIYHIVKVCCESGNSKVLYHPALMTLISYDEEYGTSFTNSLYAYLSNFMSISNAAVSLKIHRNTFVYHLKRITEIMGINLADYHTLQLLGFSFALLEYEKKQTFYHRDSIIKKEN